MSYQGFAISLAITLDDTVMTSVSVAPTPMASSVTDTVTIKVTECNDGLTATDKPAVKRRAKVKVPDCLVQQRHILAMMGIEVWAQKTQHSSVVDYEARQQQIASTVSVGVNTAAWSAPVSHLGDNSVSNLPEADVASTGVSLAAAYKLEQSRLQRGDARLSKGHLSAEPATTEQTDNQSSRPHLAAAPIQVAAFELIGVKYHNWVLLLDAVVLKDQSLSQLWANMLEGLSLTPEYLQFPICVGMSDKESAEASVAGFVFRVGKSERVQVAALTPMPEGAQPNNLIRLPYLTEMIENSDEKRQLWQRLNEQPYL